QFRDVERIARVVGALERLLFEVRERETANRVGEGLLLFGEVELHLKSSLIRHSGLMPTAFTKSDHIVSSRSMMAAYTSGVGGCGWAPRTARRPRTSSVRSAAWSAGLSVSMPARGAPAGAARPHRSGTS